ncbi:MAG: LPS assembly protein LptD [Candidatus Manganitrophus sp. SA1]|nr:LPS assembly protein LptD [Candidatus Manganitrophus morganii]
MIPRSGEPLRSLYRGSALIWFFGLFGFPSKSFSLILLVIGFLLPATAWGLPQEMNGAVLGRPKANEPIQLDADRLEYRREEDLFIAEGSVVAIQGPLRIEADAIRLDNRTGRLIAEGNVRFTDGDDRIDASRVELDVNTQLGVLHNAEIFIEVENYHIEADKAERHALDRYLLENAYFTACDCIEDPDWHIRAQRLRLQIDGYLTARNVVFYANEVPILYLPYLLYPAKTERQTGLLIPRMGYSSRDGFRYNQDFFWAISKSQDVTFNLDHRGARGDGVGLEYRYVLSKFSRGHLETNYFYDKEDQVGKWEIRYNHEQRFTDRINAKIDVHYVNQQDFFQELSDATDERAQQNIESNLFVTYRGDESFAYLLGRYTQDLTTPSNSTTAQRLPEVGYSLIEHRLGQSPVYFNFESNAVNFWRSEGLTTQRVDLYPRLSAPISLSGAGTLTPWAGIRETWYSRGTTEEPVSREIFPTGLHWEEHLSKERGGSVHLLSPSLMYEYIPVEDHPDVPQFDELDQLQDRNAVTASVTQRFMRRDVKGAMQEKIYLRFTETYNLRDARSDEEDTEPFSDFRGEAVVHFTDYLSLGFDAFYDLYDRRFSFWNTDLTINLPPYLIASLGQRYTRGGTLPQRGDLFNPLYLGDEEPAPRIQFWTEKIVIRTPWGVSLASRAYFDAETSKFVEIAYGLQYEDQCWGITVTYLDLRTRNEFSFMLTLKGLGATGSRKFASIF